MSPEQWAEARDKTAQEWERVVLPFGWREVPIKPGSMMDGAKAAVVGRTSLLFSAGKMEDGKWWLHVSIAHPDKLPSYLDLTDVKAFTIGTGRQAIQVFPPEAEHVNLHPRALHLWACIDAAGDGLPKFGKEGTI